MPVAKLPPIGLGSQCSAAGNVIAPCCAVVDVVKSDNSLTYSHKQDRTLACTMDGRKPGSPVRHVTKPTPKMRYTTNTTSTSTIAAVSCAQLRDLCQWDLLLSHVEWGGVWRGLNGNMVFGHKLTRSANNILTAITC